MKLRCERCGEEFWFSANEQRIWYEEWGFRIDSIPKHCAACRKMLREENGRAWIGRWGSTELCRQAPRGRGSFTRSLGGP